MIPIVRKDTFLIRGGVVFAVDMFADETRTMKAPLMAKIAC